MSGIKIKNKTFEVYEFIGVVAESSKQRETKVEGSGGGTNNILNGIDEIKIKSTTTIHDEFFLINDEGEEQDFKVEDMDITLRKGNIIQVLSIDGGSWWNCKPSVVVNNMTINKAFYSTKQITNIAVSWFVLPFLVSLVLSITIGIILESAALLIGLIVISILYWGKNFFEVIYSFDKEFKKFIK